MLIAAALATVAGAQTVRVDSGALQGVTVMGVASFKACPTAGRRS